MRSSVARMPSSACLGHRAHLEHGPVRRPIVVFHAMRRSGSNSMTVLSPASGSCPHWGYGKNDSRHAHIDMPNLEPSDNG
jgi:hypothetical protein